jgi:hypothetical protein
MQNRPLIPLYSLLIALTALIVAVSALMMARDSRQIALSTIEIDEGESLTLPVYDEERGEFGFLILSELEVTNAGGPAVTLNRLRKNVTEAGFLMALKGESIVSLDLKPRLFLLDRPLPDYQANPRLLKEKWGADRNILELELPLPPGAGKKIRYGIFLSPYGQTEAPAVDMVLVSLSLDFGNGKAHLFRRAYAVPPLIR